MLPYCTEISKNIKLGLTFTMCMMVGLLLPSAAAFDLIPAIFKSTKINRNIWKQQEQHVALAPQSNDKNARIAPNQHPVILDVADVKAALQSLELWVKGGFFRNEEAVPVLSKSQITTLVRYLVEGLSQASPQEDIVFVVRGYGNVAFDIVKEKFWSAGRIFYKDDKLNIIIGTFQVRKDRGIRQAEGAYGLLDNYADLRLEHGSRKNEAKMPGRIVTTAGVTLNSERNRERPDWVQIDLSMAAAAYRDSLIPEEDKKQDRKVRQEAAKLTVERRQMREEMARLRKALEKIKSGGQLPGLERRLATLKELREKDLITDDEYQDRRQSILEEI